MKDHLLVIIFTIFSTIVSAQCTEAKEPDMAKYKRLTESKDAQGCSECAFLSLYFCSARHCVNIEDKRKVGAMITACKRNIRNMGQPYCCPEYLNKEPEWGVSVGAGSSAAKKPGSTNEQLQNLSSGLEKNPDNPLGVDNNLLNEIVDLIPNENLKSVIKGYANTLNSNGEISFRQVYNDLLGAFDLNPALGMMDGLSDTKGSLDLMFNDPYTLQGFFEKSGIASSPAQSRLLSVGTTAMLNNYKNVTSMDVLNAGMDLINVIVEQIEKDNALSARHKELLEKTKTIYTTEKDPRIGASLIDAAIGHHPLEYISPIFRYDSDSGYIIRVENDILSYFNNNKKISLGLAYVEPKNTASISSAFPNRNFISINEDEGTMFVRISDSKKCSSCLSDGLYLISLIDGAIIWKHNNRLFKGFNTDILPVENIHIDKSGFFIKSIWLMDNGAVKYVYSFSKFGEDKQRSFSFNKNIKFNCFENIFDKDEFKYYYDHTQHLSVFEKDGVDASLLWVSDRNNLNSKTDLSHTTNSVIYIDSKKEYLNTDVMLNELTGLVGSKNGNLYIVDAKGNLILLINNTFKIDEPAFTNQIRQASKTKIFPAYDFQAMTMPVSSNGSLVTKEYYVSYPKLMLSPDEKWLIYIIKDELFLVDPNDFKKVKSFKLMHHPHRSYFGKENGDWVLYLQSVNEMQFTITKKYSMKRLAQDYEKPAAAVVVPQKTVESASKSTDNKASNTDTKKSKEAEFQRLIELYTKGLISEEDFKKAKAKLEE